MAEKKFTATHLGAAKAESKVFKRGYTINLVAGKPAAKPAEKTAQKPAKKKGRWSRLPSSAPHTVKKMKKEITFSFPYIAVFLVLVGCASKRTVAPVPVSAEMKLRLDARANGRVGPADIYPDLCITPGVAASDVTQENIKTTICTSGFTKPPRRPPSSYTDNLKLTGFDEYGLTDRKKGDYEEDHLISLELGGDPKNPQNLWPEPYKASIPDGGARDKDKVEKYLNRQVCNGKMTLAEAQNAIVSDWYKVYQSMPTN